MRQKLFFVEADPTTQVLPRCPGTRRKWVTTDGDRMAVVRDEGSSPDELTDPSERMSMVDNPRATVLA